MIILFLLISFLPVSFAHADDVSVLWKIKKESWSDADERNYSSFVAEIGKSGCGSFDACLKNPANPYRASDPRGVNFYSDCADLPFMLRAYFSWKNGLPFSLVSQVESADGEGNDIRYSPHGNVPTRRTDIVARPGPRFPNAIDTLKNIPDFISSAMFRFNPELPSDTHDIGGQKLARLVADYYSVDVSIGSMRPGTVIYDPNGHVAVIYSMRSDGRILYMDSHPDNSISHGTYGKKFARSNPGAGAGFKNFRPLRLVGASKDSNGNLIGGTIYYLPNERISDFDVKQYYGTKRGSTWNRGVFEIGGKEVDYYDWVRIRLGSENLKFHPIDELHAMMASLCDDIKDRVTAVDNAVKNGMDRKDQPSYLPDNIYGTSGAWEMYSSPSRDARLKTSFLELRDQIKSMVERYKAGDSRIDYPGNDIKRDLLAAFAIENAKCVIRYKLSNGALQALNFEDVRKRLFSLSFDPYHCVERRWGATSADELRNCEDNQTKIDWYKAEQRLRNQLDRAYDVKMGFSLRDLQAKVPGSGVDQAPDVDTKKYIESL